METELITPELVQDLYNIRLLETHFKAEITEEQIAKAYEEFNNKYRPMLKEVSTNGIV